MRNITFLLFALVCQFCMSSVYADSLANRFYELLQVSVKGDNNPSAVSANSWKKDLFTFCRDCKEQIETNPDPQLIYASIAVSHFDYVMELASTSQVLSEKIVSALSNAVKAKADFENGNCPDLVIGLNKLKLKRFEGAEVAEFVIHLPKESSVTSKWPVYIHIDPSRDSFVNYGQPGVFGGLAYHDGMLDIWWHTVSSKDLRWKDYVLFMEILKEKVNIIDDDRVYLFSRCGDSIATMALLVKHPDQWAKCIFSSGNSYKYLAGNATNVSIIFDNAHPGDESVRLDFAVNCFNYFGCRNFMHSDDLKVVTDRSELIPQTIRIQSPCRVLYTIESLANPSSYWVQIDGREDENFIASIDAIVWGQSVLVKTKNVDAYTLNLELAPLDSNRPVEIIENDENLGFVTGPVFVRKSEKYENAIYVKNESLPGSVADIFTDQYAVVWEGNESIKKFAEKLAGSGPCFSDADLPADFVNTHNIIFVGRPVKSKHFAQIADKLPVTIQDGRLRANGRVYEGDFGTFFVYPNPLNSQKYLAVLSGSTDKVSGFLNKAWNEMKLKDDADVGIFKVSEKNRIDWLICERFDTVWGWHESWDAPLATLSKTYPKWKWRQWMARILRRQFNADVMMLEYPYVSSELPDAGEFTLRDVSKFFRNDWLVKISLKGSDLKGVLTASFNDTLSSEDSDLVIDGVSVVRQPGNSDVLCINELDSDRYYTVAMSFKGVYDGRMKRVENYRLEGQGFLTVLLGDYLKENNDLDLSSELDRIRLNIF